MFFLWEEIMKTLYVTDLDGTLLEPDKSMKRSAKPGANIPSPETLS